VRSIGLLLLFIAIFIALQMIGQILLPSAGLTAQSLVTLVAALTAGALLLQAVERRPLAELGVAVHERTPGEAGIGFLIACGALLLIIALSAMLGAWRYRSDGGSLSGWLVGNAHLLLLLAVPAAAEEALFRGYPFQKLVTAAGPVLASVIASAGFAFAHANNPSVGWLALTNIFCAGLVLSMAFLKTRSLWFVTAVHLGWNWMMAGPLDLPVSGLELFDAPLYEPEPSGQAWLTGGAFGPEGGVSGFSALALLGLGVWTFTKRFAAMQLRSQAAKNECPI
jgi:membrane protease YdiL (CAAX protease family)